MGYTVWVQLSRARWRLFTNGPPYRWGCARGRLPQGTLSRRSPFSSGCWEMNPVFVNSGGICIYPGPSIVD